jgi:hypothetical protein
MVLIQQPVTVRLILLLWASLFYNWTLTIVINYVNYQKKNRTLRYWQGVRSCVLPISAMKV